LIVIIFLPHFIDLALKLREFLLNPDTGSNFSFVKENIFRSNYESHAIYYLQEKN